MTSQEKPKYISIPLICRTVTILLLVSLTLLFTSVACVAVNPNFQLPQKNYREAVMVKLTIDLQAGFTNDTVVIRVNDQEIFRKENVQTQLLLGYADSLKVEVPEGTVRIEIVMLSRNLSETIEFQASSDTFLAVSVQEGRITYRVSNEPFGYL